MSFSPAEPLLIVAHDAGGAEILSSWVRRESPARAEYLLEGPAIGIFARKLAGLSTLDRTAAFQHLHRFGTVLTGTGWASDLERSAIREARRQQVLCIAVLDHWIDYPERFELRGETVYPDEIWVGDEHAEALAARVLPGVSRRFVPNAYFADIREELARLSQAASATGASSAAPNGPLMSLAGSILRPEPGKVQNDMPARAATTPVRVAGGLRILYICEPRIEVSLKKFGHPNHWGYSEFEALSGFLAYLRQQTPPPAQITLRLHPSEAAGKYDDLLRGFADLPLWCGSEISLLNDIIRHDWVVGCDSMALVIARLAEKRVSSCIPAQGKPLTLPFPDIERLFG